MKDICVRIRQARRVQEMGEARAVPEIAAHDNERLTHQE